MSKNKRGATKVTDTDKVSDAAETPTQGLLDKLGTIGKLIAVAGVITFVVALFLVSGGKEAYIDQQQVEDDFLTDVIATEVDAVKKSCAFLTQKHTKKLDILSNVNDCDIIISKYVPVNVIWYCDATLIAGCVELGL